MSAPTTTACATPPDSDTLLAVEHWLESPSGFPAGGIGTTAPDPDNTVVATARGLSLTRRQLHDVLAFTEFLAGHALSGTERDRLTDDLVGAFEDTPKQAARQLRPLTGAVRQVAGMNPLERCQRRLQALTTTYTIELRRQADGADLNPIMEAVSRYNPVVRHWASSGIVLVADALTARIEQHRLVLSMVGREPESPPALRQRLLDDTANASQYEIAELAASELRLLATRAWLLDMGQSARGRLRQELARAVASALDVDVVVQQVGYRASMSQAS